MKICLVFEDILYNPMLYRFFRNTTAV